MYMTEIDYEDYLASGMTAREYLRMIKRKRREEIQKDVDVEE